MFFYVGMDDVHLADKVERTFISVNRLIKRKKPFPVNEWIMDSGAFTTIAKHGGYIEPVSVYAEQIKRWKDNGNLLAAVAQKGESGFGVTEIMREAYFVPETKKISILMNRFYGWMGRD
jgi:hypothetical protein